MQAIITTTSGLLKWSDLSAKQFTEYCYVFLFNSQYCYGDLSLLLLFVLSRHKHEEVNLLLLSIDLKQQYHFIVFYIKLSRNLYFLKYIEPVYLW